MSNRFPVPHRDQNQNPTGLRAEELDQRLAAARAAQQRRLADQLGGSGGPVPGASTTAPAGRAAPDAPAQRPGGAGR